MTAHVLVGSRMSKIYDFCGRELPPPLMSTKNLLTIDYIVKSFGNGRTREKPSIHLDYDNHEYEDYGFGLEYRFLQDYGQQPKEAIKNPNQSRSNLVLLLMNIHFCKIIFKLPRKFVFELLMNIVFYLTVFRLLIYI